MSTAVTPEVVRDALRRVQDPELPIDVVELGLVYDIRVEEPTDGGSRVEVEMTLTSMGCPCHDLIVDDVRAAAASVPGVREVEVDVVWDPPWDRSRLGESGRRSLPIIGIGV
ncbi:metal-sulfur cluster assembly factor [Nocardioides humi]|uniref:Iron-sulfur cluster assembly protein n=1 Tax=Nocardioides humi TaxID=449461 RepID=A0ABN2AB54_9ACTN|nr:metal-sulfur cluster assembly factor [Nocardioides humi]